MFLNISIQLIFKVNYFCSAIIFPDFISYSCICTIFFFLIFFFCLFIYIISPKLQVEVLSAINLILHIHSFFSLLHLHNLSRDSCPLFIPATFGFSALLTNPDDKNSNHRQNFYYNLPTPLEIDKNQGTPRPRFELGSPPISIHRISVCEKFHELFSRVVALRR